MRMNRLRPNGQSNEVVSQGLLLEEEATWNGDKLLHCSEVWLTKIAPTLQKPPSLDYDKRLINSVLHAYFALRSLPPDKITSVRLQLRLILSRNALVAQCMCSRSKYKLKFNAINMSVEHKYNARQSVYSNWTVLRRQLHVLCERHVRALGRSQT